jgi:membrane-associated phospholipid phosphatase
MSRFTLVPVAVVVALLVLVRAPQQAPARDRTDAVTSWVDVELSEIAAHRTNPPRASRGLALLSVAMLKATKVPPGHQEAAVAGAASTVLPTCTRIARTPSPLLADRKHPKHALAAGRQIGERLVARARTDGSDAVFQGTVPVGPGLWVPTPPAFAPPLEPLAGTWRTWNIQSGSQDVTAQPPAFGSRAYAREVAEVYNVSLSLTDEQKQIADFWADGAGTVTPPGHWNQIALDLIRRNRLSARFAARVLAALNTAQADAFIACWNAKFTSWSERPVTAIRREFDPNFLSYIVTPPFPSYVSGHSSTSGAASRVLGAYFRSAAPQLRAWAEEAAISRLYGGIHFRSDNEAGLVLGRKLAKAAISRYLTRADVRR